MPGTADRWLYPPFPASCPFRVTHKTAVQSPLIKPSAQFSPTGLSDHLHLKACECAFPLGLKIESPLELSDPVRCFEPHGNQVISNTGFESPCLTKGESYRFSPLETPSALCPPQEAGFTLNHTLLSSLGTLMKVECLPASVHHRRASSDFPPLSAASSAADRGKISRFPCKVFPPMLGVSDRARSPRVSRYRRAGCCLPLPAKASAPRSISAISRLNTQPERTPVNASPWPLRTSMHDSEPEWVTARL